MLSLSGLERILYGGGVLISIN
ncbi:hypothetical protein EMIT0P2_60096 [Pseudomonas sp. IT-P2]